MYDYKSTQTKNLNVDKKNKLLDDSIKDAFYILRHWFQYNLPKLLSVLNELQLYIYATFMSWLLETIHIIHPLSKMISSQNT